MQKGILSTMSDLYTIYESDGNGRKNPKEKVKNKTN